MKATANEKMESGKLN